MDERPADTLSWNAPEYEHRPRTADWFVAVWIITVAAASAAALLGSYPFGAFLLLAAGIVTIMAKRPPRHIPASIDTDGIRFGTARYRFENLAGFAVEKSGDDTGRILLLARRSFMPVISLPIEGIEPEAIDALLATHLKRAAIQESFLEQWMHYFGI